MHTAATPDAAYFDAFAAVFGAADTTVRPGEHFGSYFVRAISAPGVVEAIEATAAKLARKLPGVAVHVFTDAYATDEPMLWCETHRRFCNDKGVCPMASPAGSFSLAAPCYKAPAAAATVEVRVAGLPMWGDWNVAGILTRDSNDVVIATTVGGHDDEAFAIRHRDLIGQCAHCNKVRARSTTILLANEATGEVRPVGKSCLADYTGSALRFEALAAMTSLQDRFATAAGGVLTREAASAPTVDVVALAMRYIALDGRYIKTDDYAGGKEPTANTVRRALTWADDTRRPTVLADDLTDADRRAAAAAIEAILTEQSNSTYILNLQEAAASDWTEITGKRNRVGLLASLPGAAERAVQFAARRAAQAAEAAQADERTNAWIGEKGQRREFTGRIVTARDIDNDYGTSTLLTIDTEEGAVKVFGRVTFPAPHEYAETGSFVGKGIRLTGTITEHEEWKGTKQTKISRVKVAEII